jgi:phospholipase C
MANILPQVQNIVVVMLENRSLDNMCGWLYNPTPQPSLVLPAGSSPSFNGVNSTLWNPSNVTYFGGQPAIQVPVGNGTASTTVPDPDPEETFNNITYQLFGPEVPGTSPTWPNQGFVVNYENAAGSTANQIMQCYNPSQVPVISSLAQNFAISDAWYASVPSQTWPNRCFVHAGTSNGNVNNGATPDPYDWDVPNIFTVLESIGVDWRVYSDTDITPSLTRTMFPNLWGISLENHFSGFGDFQDDCSSGSLPPYSFLEPSFLFEPNDEHPPHDVTAGEQFLYAIWQAVSAAPSWPSGKILLVITYDEHGGCYDHVMPPWNATIPDAASNPGDSGFYFNRFGVRVPTVVVSPYVKPGTVFRSPGSVPYDHTSILATLRDWLGISSADMLLSARIAAAPTLAQVLTLPSPGPTPTIAQPIQAVVQTSLDIPLNDLQKSLISASARRFGMLPAALLAEITTRRHAVDFFKSKVARKKPH